MMQRLFYFRLVYLTAVESRSRLREAFGRALLWRRVVHFMARVRKPRAALRSIGGTTLIMVV